MYDSEVLSDMRESIVNCAQYYFDLKIDESSLGYYPDTAYMDKIIYIIGRACRKDMETTESAVKQRAGRKILSMDFASIYKNEGRTNALGKDAFEKRIDELFRMCEVYGVNTYKIISYDVLARATGKSLKEAHVALSNYFVKFRQEPHLIETKLFDKNLAVSLLEKCPTLIYSKPEKIADVLNFIIKKYQLTYCNKKDVVLGENIFENEEDVKAFSNWIERNARILSVDPEKIEKIFVKLHFDSEFVREIKSKTGYDHYQTIANLFNDPIYCYTVDKLPLEDVVKNAKNNVDLTLHYLNKEQAEQLFSSNPFVYAFDNIKYEKLLFQIKNSQNADKNLATFVQEGMTLFYDKADTQKYGINISKILDFSPDDVCKKILETPKTKQKNEKTKV